MSTTLTPRQVIDALMAEYGGAPVTPSTSPATPGWYYALSSPARTLCIPPVPTTTPATDPTTWATALINAAGLTKAS